MLSQHALKVLPAENLLFSPRNIFALMLTGLERDTNANLSRPLGFMAIVLGGFCVGRWLGHLGW